MAGRRVRMLSLFPLWRACARRVNSIASRLPGTNRLRFAFHGGQRVEKQVRDMRHRLWQDAPAFKSLVALNAWLQQRCIDLWQELPHPQDKRRTLDDYWQAERDCLMDVPAAFDGFIEFNKRVTSTCLISHEHNRYSVPASFANRPVSLRVYPNRLVIVAEANVIATHERVFSRDHSVSGKTIYDWRHYLSVVQRKPGACLLYTSDAADE